MKNDVMKRELDRELQNVRVSSELKKRILTEATASRMPQRRKPVSVMPLAAAAAVVLMIGLAACVTMLRAEKPDLSVTPLSAATSEPVKKVVYVSDGDGLYHWQAACGGMTEARAVEPEEARAEGRKACSACLTEGATGAEKLVWMTSFGNYYHAQHDCSGMSGAVGVLEIEAKTLGRRPCQMCAAEAEIFYDPEIAATVVPSMIPVLLDDGAEVKHAAELTCTPWPDPTAAPTTTPEPEEQALPTSVATVEPTLIPEEYDASSAAVVMNESGDISFWMTDGGVYYHVAEHCSGMEGAHVCTEEEAVKAGKILCMVCMPEEASSVVDYHVEEMNVWMTDKGRYYHVDEHCSGMEGAYACGESEAIAAGKQSCPVCLLINEVTDGPSAVWVTDEETMSVWTTDDGVYYHVDEHCSGMDGAYVSDESAAVENGKFPCPVCLADSYAEVVQFVWMTQNGVYYHSDEHCSGMDGAYGCEVLEALANGKTPCPKCAKQLSSVWVTENGMYYHLNPECSGMTGAKEISGRDAVMQGKTLCPNCRKEIVEAAIAAARRYDR